MSRNRDRRSRVILGRDAGAGRACVFAIDLLEYVHRESLFTVLVTSSELLKLLY